VSTVSTEVPAQILAPGEAEGRVAALAEPLSFWGGYDAATGEVIDRWHPGHGRSLAGRVLVMRAGRGSSSGSSVLAEAIRAGSGPAAIVLAEPDAILAIGAIVAQELYGRACPVVLVSRADLAAVAAMPAVRVDASGERARVVPLAEGG
jgi:predicted aconitase with swiveling domain